MIAHTPEKFQEVFQAASQQYEKKPDWVTFYREVLGTVGLVRRAFPETDSLAAFEESAEFDAIQQMVAKLRRQPPPSEDDNDPTRVITVRMPASLHESLRGEAKTRRTSMNKLCISKLLQVIDETMIPSKRKSKSVSKE